MNWVYVGLGGALGSMARYALALWMPHESGKWPLATFAVNLLGCLLIGMLWGLNERWQWLTPALRQLLMIGMLGGFTTFSSFGLESMDMIRQGQIGLMLAYVAASCVGGIALALLGAKLFVMSP